MKKQIIILIIALVSIKGFSQDVNSFFSKADMFFKTYVNDGKVAYSEIHKNQNSLNELMNIAKAISVTKESLNTPPTEVQPKPSEASDEVTPPTTKPTEQPKPTVQEEVIDAGERHMIVLGVYGNKANAEKLVIDVFSKGYDADLVPKSNLYQVAIILKCEKKEVSKRLKAIKKDFPSAWWKR